MSTGKTLVTWLLLCIACAAGTILTVQLLDKLLGLRAVVSSF
ncbi:MAG TPA: hypothetical protein VKU19_12330 [Bryobacteraceae bacterium]|nr:hypothetical protein [Bryobacteraceae bacterium]